MRNKIVSALFLASLPAFLLAVPSSPVFADNAPASCAGITGCATGPRCSD